MAKPNKQASETPENRRVKPFIMKGADPHDPMPPESVRRARLAEHKASRALGPDAGGSVRLQTRGKLGDERTLVRSMYDIANAKPKRRRRRRRSA